MEILTDAANVHIPAGTSLCDLPAFLDPLLQCKSSGNVDPKKHQ